MAPHSGEGERKCAIMIVGETKTARASRTDMAKGRYASEKDFEEAGGHLSYWQCGNILIPEVHSYPYLGGGSIHTQP